MNRCCATCAVLFIAAFTGTGVRAAPQADKAAGILAEARKAIGAKAIEHLSSLNVDASVKRDVGQMQLDSTLEMLFQLPDKYVRSETLTRGPMTSTSTTGFNGDAPIQRFSSPPSQGGVMMFRMGGPGAPPPGPDGKPAELTPEQKAAMSKAAVRSATVDVSRLMLGWFAMAFPSLDATYTYAGEAVSPDGKADVIDVKGADGFAARLFIDEQRHLPLMLTYTAPKPRIITMSRGRGPGGAGRGEATASPDAIQKQAQQAAGQPPEMAEYTLYFDDWRSVDGLKFPYSIKQAMAGTTMEDWTVTKVQINPTIDPKKFDAGGL
ncbi:MAG: hypothetical protein ACRD1V_06640 [Vicinamibacterales bacterium]